MGTIQQQFKHDDSARQSGLERARLAASLVKPWILPPQDQHPNEELPEAYQSIGAMGFTNIEGRVLMATFPPNAPWFQIKPSAEIRYDPSIPDADKQELAQRLYLRELMVQSILESKNLERRKRKSRSGFRSRKRRTISQVLLTGDALEKLDDQYRLTTFRRDQYVTKRDSAGDVLRHITREKVDPLTLEDADLRKAEIDIEAMEKKSVGERMVDLFTRIEWQPRAETWLIQQEVNDAVIREREETISPYFSTPFELVSGEDYGRGFGELNLGNLRSVNELNEKMLDFAAMASKHLIAKDYSSQVRDEDFAKPTGSTFLARVVNGVIQDAAMFSADKVNDFRVVFDTLQMKTSELSRALLLESEVQPTGERVTATQIQRIALELEGALGGLYAPIADDQQTPLLDRTLHQLERDNLLTPLPDDTVEVEVLTGINALQREVEAGKTMELAQVISNFGPEAMAHIDLGVLVNSMARYKGIDEPGLVKTKEERQQERAEEIQAQLAQKGGEQAIESAGAIAEQTATADTANQGSE